MTSHITRFRGTIANPLGSAEAYPPAYERVILTVPTASQNSTDTYTFGSSTGGGPIVNSNGSTTITVDNSGGAGARLVFISFAVAGGGLDNPYRFDLLEDAAVVDSAVSADTTNGYRIATTRIITAGATHNYTIRLTTLGNVFGVEVGQHSFMASLVI